MTKNRSGEMQLTTRQKSILQLLLEETAPISAKELGKRLGVSTRTIRYDVDDIEFWLRSLGMHLTRKPKVGIWLDISKSEANKIKSTISTNNPYTIVLSQEDRVFYILLELLKDEALCTSEGISEKLGVSRATIIKDLKEVKKLLNYNGIKLISRQGVGYKAHGPEDSIRKMLGKVFLYFEDTQDLLNLLSNFGDELILSSDYFKEVSTSINIQEIKKKNVPIIVDAAAEQDLRKYVAMGADLVIYSGAKAIEGPTSGFITGKKDLVAFCKLQYRGIGRAMKVGKENVVGLLKAVERYEKKENNPENLKKTMEWLAEMLSKISGFAANVVQDEAGRAIYRAQIKVDESVLGISAEEVIKRLENGNPAIYTRNHYSNLGIISIDPRPLFDGEEKILLQRFEEIANIKGE